MSMPLATINNPYGAYGLGNGARQIDYDNITSGDIVPLQFKPAITTDGTVTLYGFQMSPRVQDGIGMATMVGFQSELFLRGTTGDITGDLRAFQAQVVDQNAGTRTISGPVSMLDAWHQLAGTHTFTKGIFVINCRPAGGGAGWTAFARAEASGAGGIVVSADGMTANPEGDTEAGFIRIAVDTTIYQVPMYAQ